MPKPLQKVDDFFIRRLRQELEHQLKFKIETLAHCRVASEAILQSGVGSISASTLYRLTLGRSEDHSFYRHTLDLLSSFAVDMSWPDFCQFVESEKNHLFLCESDLASHQTLMHFCLIEKNFNPIQQFLDQFIPLSGVSSELKIQIGLYVYRALEETPDVECEFYDYFANHRVFKECFFLRCADDDFHLSHYSYGLRKFFESLVEADGIAMYTFVASMLCRYYSLLGNKHESLFYWEALERRHAEIANEIHLFPVHLRFRFMVLPVYLRTYSKQFQRRGSRAIAQVREMASAMSLGEREIAFNFLLDATLKNALSSRDIIDEFEDVIKTKQLVHLDAEVLHRHTSQNNPFIAFRR